MIVITEENKEKISFLYRNHANVKEIEKMLGIKYSEIKSFLESKGLYRGFYYNGSYYKNAATVARQLMGQGVPISNVAKELNLPYNSVYVLKMKDRKYKGVEYPEQKGGEMRKVAAKRKCIIAERLKSGEELKTIAADLGISYPAAYYHYRNLKKENKIA